MRQILYDIWAAFTALTRLPFWRIKEVPHEHFRHITDHWSLVGWLTGGVMAGVIWSSGQFLPTPVAVTLAFIVRLLLTGALHEDGLMDLFDGFGGGRSRERVLEIMKDSHTGAYATIGFVAYALLWVSLLGFLELRQAMLAVLIADPLSKFVVAHMPMLLPYARKESESKMQTVYRRRIPVGKWILSALFGLLPILLWYQVGWVMLVISLLLFLSMIAFLKKRIGGYTGDCIGAVFLICEVGSYIGVWIALII